MIEVIFTYQLLLYPYHKKYIISDYNAFYFKCKMRFDSNSTDCGYLYT